MKRFTLMLLLYLLLPLPVVLAKKETNMDKEALTVLFRRGCACFERQQANEAMHFFQAVIARIGEKDSPSAADMELLADSWNNVGRVNMFLRYDYGQALDNLIRAREIYKDKDQPKLLFNLGTLTGFYAQCFPTPENIKLSNDFFRKAFTVACTRKERELALTAFYNLWNFGFTPQMLAQNRDVMTLFSRLPASQETAYTDARTVYDVACLMEQGKAGEAVRMLSAALLQPRQATEDNRDLCQLLWLLAEVAREAGMQRELGQYGRMLAEQASRSGYKDFEMDASELLYEHFKAIGNEEAAARCHLRYFEKRDSLLIFHRLNTVSNGFLQHNLQTTQARLDSLNKVHQAQNIIVTVVVAGIVAALVLLFILRDKNRKLRERNLALYQKTLDTIRKDSLPRYQGVRLDDEEKSVLFEKVKQVMAHSEDIYKDDFTLEMLARLCNTSYKKLSQTINERYGNTFSIMLSDYRIREACKRINNVDDYGHFTIEAIGRSVGFKARSGFFRAFKRVTGLTPSEFMALDRTSRTKPAS